MQLLLKQNFLANVRKKFDVWSWAHSDDGVGFCIYGEIIQLETLWTFAFILINSNSEFLYLKLSLQTFKLNTFKEYGFTICPS